MGDCAVLSVVRSSEICELNFDCRFSKLSVDFQVYQNPQICLRNCLTFNQLTVLPQWHLEQVLSNQKFLQNL